MLAKREKDQSGAEADVTVADAENDGLQNSGGCAAGPPEMV
jgi:hypothetical protein